MLPAGAPPVNPGGPAAAATVPGRMDLADQDAIITNFLNALPRKAKRDGGHAPLAEKGPRKPLTALQQTLECLRKASGDPDEAEAKLQGYAFRWVLYNVAAPASGDRKDPRVYPTLKNVAMTEAEWQQALRHQEPPHREDLPELPLAPCVVEGFAGLKQRMDQLDKSLTSGDGFLAHARVQELEVDRLLDAAREQGERRQQLHKKMLALRKRVLEVSQRLDVVLSDPRYRFTTSLVTERGAEVALTSRFLTVRRQFIEPECVQSKLTECEDRALALAAAREDALARGGSMRGGAREAPRVRPEFLEEAFRALQQLHHSLTDDWTRVDEADRDLQTARKALKNMQRCGCARSSGEGAPGGGGAGGGGGKFFVAGGRGW